MTIPKSLYNAIALLGGSQLSDKMDLCLQHVEELREFFSFRSVNKSFRRLSSFSDSEGKTRLVAIGDYFSQTVLKPLHQYLNKVLRCIPQDQTFDQGEGLRDLPFESSTTYYSYDLRAFTDRFPIRLIMGLLTVSASLAYANVWYRIINGYPFDYIDPKGHSQSIRYSVGNPMGFYTS